MVALVRDVVRRIVSEYPFPDELTQTRLTKLVYLADWVMATKESRQMTDIHWYFDHYGPYVPDVFQAASKDKALTISSGQSPFGNPREVIRVAKPADKIETPTLTRDDETVIALVIKKIKDMTWNEFLSFVYSTKPVQLSERYSFLDLVAAAKQKEGHPERVTDSRGLHG